MASYKLTEEAKEDLFSILEYGTKRYGFERASEYFYMMHAEFERIARNPFQFPVRLNTRRAYRQSVCGAHSIYFALEDDTVVIVAVLGMQDRTKRL